MLGFGRSKSNLPGPRSGVGAPRTGAFVAAFFALLLWILFFATPVAAVLFRAGNSGPWDPVVGAVAWVTLRQALLSLTFSLAFGVPLGLVVAWLLPRDSRSAAWARSSLAAPFGVPTVVAGLVGLQWMGKNGWLAQAGLPGVWAYSLAGVIAVHVLYNAPWIALVTAQGRWAVPVRELEVIRNIGGGAWARFRLAVLPRLSSRLFATALQVYCLCCLSFGLVLVLGGGPPVQTLEVLLDSRLRGSDLNWGSAAWTGTFQFGMTALPALIGSIWEKRRRSATQEVTEEGSGRSGVGALEVSRKRWLGGLVLALTAIPLLPWFIFVLGALGDVWRDADFLFGLARAAGTSITLSLASAVLTLLWVGLAHLGGRSHPRVHWILALMQGLPAGVSSLVLALGAALAFGRWVDPFEGAWVWVVVIQTVVALPWAYRALGPVLEKASLRELEAVRSAGASAVQAYLWVEWPRIRGSVRGVGMAVAALGLGELGAAGFFLGEGQAPLAVWVSRYFSQYRFEEAHAVGACLTVLALGGLFAARGRSS